MATARMKKVDEFLTCTICTDIYTDPCTLTCLHTFCRKCVTQYTKTRTEALQTKTIPCPNCRQVTKVPDPTKPVEKWAWQIKPSIIILGLIDTSHHDPTTEGRSCDTCQEIGETTPAKSWCSECEVALCERCTKIHRASPMSRDHDVCDLSEKVRATKKRKVMCREHQKNCIEFHCEDCKKSACQKCCIIYHRACKSVLDIESMRQEMATELLKKRGVLHENLEKKIGNIKRNKTAINESTENKVRIKSQIRSASQKAMDKIKRKETQLMNQLDEVTEKQMSQLRADVKTEEIDVQMYRQHCAFIDQTVNSECVMDMYDMYQACESGALVLGDVGEADTEERAQCVDITFTQDPVKFSLDLDKLELGVLDVTDQETGVLLGSPVLTRTIHTGTQHDNKIPGIRDVTVLDVGGVQTVVVTDAANGCLKSFCIRNGKLFKRRLPLSNFPQSLAHFKENKVLVTVPLANWIITVEVTPELLLLSTIKTVRTYWGLGLISPSSLAAGTGYPDYCVDILNMAGQVMKSVRTNNGKDLFSNPVFICVNKGNIVVSDWGKKSVTCLTGEGDFLWQYTPKGHRAGIEPGGITSTGNGDILVAYQQSQKVIQLSTKGEFMSDILTSTDSLVEPCGLVFTRRRSLFVCNNYTYVKQFNFV